MRPLGRWDKKYIWHPFTQQSEWDALSPIIIESGKGVWLKDSKGRRFIDGVSSLWVNVWGHQKKELDRAIHRQVKPPSPPVGEGGDGGSPPPQSRQTSGESPAVWRPPSFLRGEEVHDILRRHHRSIAAVVMEPLIQGASGMRIMPKGYLAHISKLCQKYQALLIVDEVATGFGRTGTMFASEHEGV